MSNVPLPVGATHFYTMAEVKAYGDARAAEARRMALLEAADDVLRQSAPDYLPNYEMREAWANGLRSAYWRLRALAEEIKK